jgi:hypothetical protein
MILGTGDFVAHRIFRWQSRLSKIPDNSEEKECLIHNTSDPLPE